GGRGPDRFSPSTRRSIELHAVFYCILCQYIVCSIPMKERRSRRSPTTRIPRSKSRPKTRSTSAEPRMLTTMRLRESLRRDLEIAAARSRRSLADVTQELLEEALRMRQCPGIFFAEEPSGRTAKIGGTGLAVWEIMRDYAKDQDADRLRKAFPQL